MPRLVFIHNHKGFTLIELILGILIIAILALLTNAAYRSVFDQLDTSKAIADLHLIELKIERYLSVHHTLPINLDILDIPDDPWGRPYRYSFFADVAPLPVIPIGSNISGGAAMFIMKRLDRNSIPINSNYDLYSSGPDGLSAQPLTENSSRDDIIRANNGGFMGLAVDF